jgi:hypothetical protein
MPDYEKTYQFFERVNYTNHLKRDPPAWVLELNHLRNWKAKITDPNTKEPRKNTANPDQEYPIKSVTVIKRIMTAKGEYLLSNQRWIGRTSIQNNHPYNMDNAEMYDEPIFQTQNKINPKDPNDIIQEVVGVETWIRHYTLPNTPENLKALMAMADPNQPPTFTVADFRVGGGSPRSVETFEELRDKPFNELLNPPWLKQQAQQTQTQTQTRGRAQ